MRNKHTKTWLLILLGVCFALGILHIVRAKGNVTGIIVGGVFSLIAAVLAFIVLKGRPASKRYDFADFLTAGGALGIMLLVQGIIVAASAGRNENVTMSVLFLLLAGGGLLYRALRHSRRGRHHDEQTLRAWDEWEQNKKRTKSAPSETQAPSYMSCPRCGATVHEDEDVCEQCGNIFLQNYENEKRDKRGK